MRFLLLLVASIFLAVGTAARANTLELYVDTATKQVYTEPGPNRARLENVLTNVPVSYTHLTLPTNREV